MVVESEGAEYGGKNQMPELDHLLSNSTLLLATE